MSYLALARQYRPDDFSKILAQNHITRTLANAITTGRISHAYLFCGPRGTGKTSTARVLAKSLNCETGPTSSPCGECVYCKEIKTGISPDVFEIDAASNRGIDDIRELRENVRYAPASARYKIYIIDEVHRLTNEAFDALLKTLEEPPPHVIFMFATTEPQNLPATILSRTQRFDFKRVPVSSLAETVTNVAKQEGLEIEPKAALLIGRKADGSLRDALSLLDQLISFSEGQITTRAAAEILGLVKTEFLFDITSAVINHDTANVLELFNIYFGEGNDIDQLAAELMTFFSKLLMIKNGIRETALLELDTKEIEKAENLIAEIDTSDILRMMKMMGDFIINKKAGVDPVVAIEVALTGMSGLDKTIDISRLLAGMSQNPGNSGGSGPAGTYSNAGSVKPQANASKSVKFQRPTETSPGATAAPPASPRKLNELDKWWPNFLSFIKAKSLPIWSHLHQLKLEGAEKNTVKLGYNDENKHIRQYLAKDKKFVLEQLSEFSGNEIGLSFVRSKMENGEINNSKNLPGGNVDEFLVDHPMLKKVYDLVEGEYPNLKERNK